MTPNIERDYSHRTLFDKLGLRSDMHVAMIGNHDEAFSKEVSARLPSGPSTQLRTKYDMIFLRVDDKSDLKIVPRAEEHLKPDGALWIFHPKGKGANPTDAEVRAAGLAAGLVDNKISSYTDSHTATRYVIPRERR